MTDPVLTDSQIEELIHRAKPLPEGWRKRLRLRQHKGEAHKRAELQIDSNTEVFVIKCRQNSNNPLDFSIILVYKGKTGCEYRLLRCNGKHPSQHTHRWERDYGREGATFGPSFHVHRATERYQEAGLDIDGFAEPTDAYSDYFTGLEHFAQAGCFVDPERPKPDMFGDFR